MSESLSMGERMFGTEPSPQTQTPAVAPPDAASRLYAEPEPEAAKPDASIERRMFGDTAFVAELPDGAIADFDAKAGRQVAQDIGADSDDVTGFRMLASQPAPTAEQHTEWRNAAEIMVKQREFTPADIDLARRFVARDKRLYAALDGGLGSHPRVVERMVMLARAARNAGRFR